ncbi:class II aldolase/adducin family protein [Accumulibacter sp.]|uniref:class II aldolase/adducin family protein n=1 Tax=Accumulibacter sp. TaxID=2053492 RepID=UPI0035B21904
MVELRQRLIDCARRMGDLGLNRGTAGNLSVRAPAAGEPGGFLITPSGMAYDALQPGDIVHVRPDGVASGCRQPSSEWRFHRDLYARRADAGAILHAHSPFATSLACLRRDIPAFHYMIARFGGDSLRCSDYATFGTQELSAAVLRAIDGRCGCLLANHGMLVFGRDLPQALALGVELEALCEQYWRACQLAPPVLLDSAEMARVLAKFAGYGQQS